jgi:hypothetical protein
VIGVVSASDPDRQDTLKFKLESMSPLPIKVDQISGVLTVSDPSLIDFEQLNGFNNFDASVVVTDSTGLSSRTALHIDVLDQPEAPVLSNLQISVDESPSSLILGSVSLVDADGGDHHTFDIQYDNCVIPAGPNSLIPSKLATPSVYVHTTLNTGTLEITFGSDVLVTEQVTTILISPSYVQLSIVGSDEPLVGRITPFAPDAVSVEFSSEYDGSSTLHIELTKRGADGGSLVHTIVESNLAFSSSQLVYTSITASGNAEVSVACLPTTGVISTLAIDRTRGIIKAP